MISSTISTASSGVHNQADLVSVDSQNFLVVEVFSLGIGNKWGFAKAEEIRFAGRKKKKFPYCWLLPVPISVFIASSQIRNSLDCYRKELVISGNFVNMTNYRVLPLGSFSCYIYATTF
uniref:Uncharacterized protein n=1 Tax=Arundo donax TaxID=35708 RepID=A0A0A9HV76_ARUDO